MTVTEFKKIVWKHYNGYGRHDLAWRKTHDPYKILVSEVMLQQTQVARVKTKYEEFLKKFPDVKALAKGSTKDVLTLWQGLGYNRRALYLKKAAEITQRDFNGTFPSDREQLESLPGIGQSTSGAILAFAFNIPVVFIETNIRSIFIHHFFKDKKKISDTHIISLIEKTLDQKNPREWYYALMDYGVHLKTNHPNPSRKSSGHKTQSKFKGSNRELRAAILRFVLKKSRTESEIIRYFREGDKTPEQIVQNIRALQKEGFSTVRKGRVSIL